MKQYEKFKEDISKCDDPMEIIGFLDGVEAAALIFCRQNCPEEVYKIDTTNKITIDGMKQFFESEV